MYLKKSVLFITSFMASIVAFVSYASPLKDDEAVIFFPSSATQSADGSWSAPIHHWVFEKEEGSIGRKITQKVLSEVLESLGVTEKQAESDVTQQRLMWFLVDNQRRKLINISVNGKQKKLNVSQANGHAHSNIKLSGLTKLGSWVSYKAIDPFKRTFSGDIQLIPNTGLSVISDIDDTIKISNVLDKKELIKNTFVNPYLVTNGFPEYYKELQESGAFFHYVSASPWQLYPTLKPFMDENYPKGTISLRNFRVKDSSLLKFLEPSTEYKINTITSIINRYPKHQFILIGDSGEHDPEIYAKIYSKFSSNIQSIQIRKVEGSDLTKERFATTFKQVPVKAWKLVSNPSENVK